MTSSNGNTFRVTGPLCGEFTGPGEFPTQRPVTQSFGVFFDLRLNKRMSKQPWGWWFQTPSWSLWCQCNGKCCDILPDCGSYMWCYIIWDVLTHWGQGKIATISQTTFSNTFPLMKMCEFGLRFHWNLFLRFELTIFRHWFRKWLGADQATSHYLNHW